MFMDYIILESFWLFYKNQKIQLLGLPPNSYDFYWIFVCFRSYKISYKYRNSCISYEIIWIPIFET